MPVRPGWRAESSTTSRPRDGSGADRVHLLGEPRAAHPVVEARERVERRDEALALAADLGRELVEDALLLRGRGELRLAPRVRQVDRDERLDEQRLAAPRLVVDDAPDATAGVGLDRHDVAAVAQRDDRLLQRARRARSGRGCRVGPGAARRRCARRAAGRPSCGEAASAISAARLDRGLEPRPAAPAAARCERRARAAAAWAARGARRPVAAAATSVSPIDQELGRLEPAAAGRTLDMRADVPSAADADVRPLPQEPARLVGLVEPATDHDRVGRRLERLREPARRRERGVGREPLAHLGVLEQLDRAFVHQPRPSNGRLNEGWSRSPKRHGRSAQPGPAYATPMRGPLTIAGDRLELGVARRSGSVASSASGPPSSRSRPSSARSMPSAWQRRAGPAAEPCVGSAGRPAPRAHGVDARDRLERPDEHRARLAVGAAHDVQAVMQPVDEVDVGVTRLART